MRLGEAVNFQGRSFDSLRSLRMTDQGAQTEMPRTVVLSEAPGDSRLLFAGVARGFDKFVRFFDVGGLGGEHLAHGQRDTGFHCLAVGFDGFVFGLFGGGEQGVVAATQCGLEVAPCAADGADGVCHFL